MAGSDFNLDFLFQGLTTRLGGGGVGLFSGNQPIYAPLKKLQIYLLVNILQTFRKNLQHAMIFRRLPGISRKIVKFGICNFMFAIVI